MNTRRLFLTSISIASLGLAMDARAEGALDEKDPQALALGYVSDASRADAVKFPKYSPGQACGKCVFFQGKPGDAAGACALFGGKQVKAQAWCSNWVARP